MLSSRNDNKYNRKIFKINITDALAKEYNLNYICRCSS